LRIYTDEHKFGLVEEGVKKNDVKIDDKTYWDLIVMARFGK